MNQLRSLSQAFRRAALPLASYYAVTLALPLAHGAPSSDRFLEQCRQAGIDAERLYCSREIEF